MDRAASFPPLPAEPLERWSRFGKSDTVFFPQYLGLRLEELRTDYARMRLAYKPEFRQPAGVWHGDLAATATLTYKVSSRPPELLQ